MFVTTDDAFAQSINHFIRSRMRTLLLRLVILPRFEVELSRVQLLDEFVWNPPTQLFAGMRAVVLNTRVWFAVLYTSFS